MRILVTPTFERAVKKLHKQQKAALDEAVRAIASQPEAGETKVGDLAGVQVYKFCMGNLLCLLAYRVLDENTLVRTRISTATSNAPSIDMDSGLVYACNEPTPWIDARID
jgi:mRNA-degrading endonuclease RelE of RelBE toxin-antitoxin system